MMPPGGGAARGDQLAVLAGLAHALLTAPEVGDDLAAAEAAGAEPIRGARANLRLMRHAHTRATALPPDLVEAQARANSACEKVWREARRAVGFRPGAAASGRGRAAGARGRRRAGTGARPQPVRRADGRLPARHRRSRRRAGIRRLRSVPARALPRGRGASGAQAGAGAARGPVSRSRSRRRCAAACPSGSAWISTTRGSTGRRIRSPAARRPTCGSPRATTRRTSPRRCWRWCTRPAMRCTSAACRRRGRASRSARPPAWRRMKASR